MAKKRLSVPNVTGLLHYKDMQNVSTVLDGLKPNLLNTTPWQSTFPYKPKVNFTIAHADGFIFLKFNVAEKAIRAVNSDINGAVYEDSCVEFFVNFDEKGYYNIECNCIGTMLMGFGPVRNNRERLPADVINKITFHSTMLKNTKDNTIDWAMTLAIPLSVFIHHLNLSLAGKTGHANFYKCGDKLPEPHYLTWSNIDFVKPNFHLPEFFGDLVFE
jgi:Carbohydrate-binding family 9